MLQRSVVACESMRVLVMVLLASISAPTVAASATTLPAVLARVYEQSPLLAAARADLRALDEQSPIARAGRRPSIGLTSSTGMIVKGTGDTPDGAHAGRAGLFLEQLFFGPPRPSNRPGVRSNGHGPNSMPANRTCS
ncbi:MAG: hypothetical protein KDG54_18420 [Geminicoccaceae bacterium]|nr:hypothetical protein [Geminicoccaceae bacterium]